MPSFCRHESWIDPRINIPCLAGDHREDKYQGSCACSGFLVPPHNSAPCISACQPCIPNTTSALHPTRTDICLLAPNVTPFRPGSGEPRPPNVPRLRGCRPTWKPSDHLALFVASGSELPLAALAMPILAHCLPEATTRVLQCTVPSLMRRETSIAFAASCTLHPTSPNPRRGPPQLV